MVDTIGVNEQSIDLLAIKILKWNDEIVQSLNDIDDIITASNTYYDCNSGNTLRSKMSDSKPNFVTIQENLEVYSQDLVRVKENLSNFDKKTITIVDNAINSLSSTTNTLINREEKN